MNEDILSQLSAEEQELASKLAELRSRKAFLLQQHNEELARQKREESLAKPITIQVTGVQKWSNGDFVMTESPFREDLIALMRTIPSRVYTGGKHNAFAIGDWPSVVEKLKELKNVTVEYLDAADYEIEILLRAPNWLVELDQRWLIATPARNVPQKFILHTIAGAQWNTEKQRYAVPLTEAHNVWKRLEGIDKVEWSDEAREFVIKQIERRTSLDKIAELEIDEKYAEFDLNGIKLRPFQSVGARFIETADGNAILADEMGLGKTPQAIAYAHMLGFKKVVVIVPASLKPNWSREIKKFTGKTAKVLYGAEPSRYDLVNLVASDSPFEWFIINYDIVGRKTVQPEETKVNEEGYTVTYPAKDRFLWAEIISMARPDLVIVDEGHYIKNLDSNRSKAIRGIKAQRFLFLTGTPVLNRPGELWPMLTKISPEQFPAFETFVNQYTYDGKTVRNKDELHEVLRPLMIRRLKSQVYPELPAVDRRQIYHELSPKALKAYNKVLMGVYDAIEDYHPGQAGATMKVTSILAQIQRLKMISAIDKAERTAELAQELYDQTDESEHRKVIIFTQYKGVAYKIAKLLGKDALSFVTRHGSEFVTADGPDRDRMVQQFQTDDSIKYLVVTEKTTKEGHNITAAGHVIFNDLFWTPAGHDQAIGRAYGRISDMHGVDAYFIIGTSEELGDEDGSIEEWIWQLLGFKQGVIEESVEGVESSRDVSIGMMLIEKIRNSMGARKR